MRQPSKLVLVETLCDILGATIEKRRVQDDHGNWVWAHEGLYKLPVASLKWLIRMTGAKDTGTPATAGENQ